MRGMEESVGKESDGLLLRLSCYLTQGAGVCNDLIHALSREDWGVMRPEDRPLIDALYEEIDYLVMLLRAYTDAYGDIDGPITKTKGDGQCK